MSMYLKKVPRWCTKKSKIKIEMVWRKVNFC